MNNSKDSSDHTGSDMREIIAKRRSVLKVLNDEPLWKPELDEQLDVSRSTINRAVNELAEIGLIERIENGYTSTMAGELGLDLHTEYVEKTNTLARAAGLLEDIPEEIELEPDYLDECTVVLPERQAPEKVLESLAKRLQPKSTVMGFTPVVKVPYVSLLRDHVIDNDIAVEVIIEDTNRCQFPEFASVQSALIDLASANQFQLLETSVSLPYGLWIIEYEKAMSPIVALLGYSDRGVIAGGMVWEENSVYEWAEQRYEQVRESAVRASISLTGSEEDL
ncbi:GntR family transcriptional regulator [Salinarchaeum sp. IM2453]|uniref:helix-turn-helix transcriptional regulator n=1 Tax=Salinarchaeum sp. IM2453 TaxID=2862870 RepID=UPI001C83A667|nr:HTH domain-containing protein [Salinarchaeum sp. IM2453]QZA88172.1 GntR family transcriptional regulator [Salinarchaeum sp. IM2453]